MTVNLTDPLPAIDEGDLLVRDDSRFPQTMTLAHLVAVLEKLTAEQRRAVVRAARIGLDDFPECEAEPAYEGPEPLL